MCLAEIVGRVGLEWTRMVTRDGVGGSGAFGSMVRRSVGCRGIEAARCIAAGASGEPEIGPGVGASLEMQKAPSNDGNEQWRARHLRS